MNSDYTAFVDRTKELLSGSGFLVGGYFDYWSKLTWEGRDAQTSGVPVIIEDYTAYLYPASLSADKDRAENFLIKAAGDAYFSTLSEDAADLWANKYTLPNVSQIRAYQGRLKNESYTSYLAIVESFNSPVDRLVAIHLSNALIANGVSVASARNLDVTSWPATEEYANRGRYHSLTPIIGAYATEEVRSSFGSAVAEAVRGYPSVTHSDIKNALGSLILRVMEELPVA